MSKKLIENKEIISPKIILGTCGILAVALVYLLWSNSVNENSIFESIVNIFTSKTSEKHEKIMDAMLGTEITLLVTAVTMLSVITSFLQTRYLGANYKYWFFRERVYRLLPQTMVFLMLAAIAGTSIMSFFGRWCWVWICYGLSWWMFILLNHRIFVAVIKVSKLFLKLKLHLCDGTKDKRLDWCKLIYDKLTDLNGEEQSVHNSYFYEEIGIILYMMKTYTECCNVTEHAECMEKCERLYDILLDRIKTEATAKFRGEKRIGDCTKHEVKVQLLQTIVEKGNGEFQKSYAYKGNKSVKKNLELAIKEWILN